MSTVSRAINDSCGFVVQSEEIESLRARIVTPEQALVELRVLLQSYQLDRS